MSIFLNLSKMGQRLQRWQLPSTDLICSCNQGCTESACASLGRKLWYAGTPYTWPQNQSKTKQIPKTETSVCSSLRPSFLQGLKSKVHGKPADALKIFHHLHPTGICEYWYLWRTALQTADFKLNQLYKILYNITRRGKKKSNRKQLLTWGLSSPPCLAASEELLHHSALSVLSYSHGQILLTYTPPCK